MNILFLGAYLPELSFEAIQNRMIAKALREEGYNLILVSSSWCKVSKGCFCGNFKELKRDDVFDERFFIDPLQLRYCKNGIFGALTGLSYQITEKYDIDIVLITNIYEYALTAKYLKCRLPDARFILADFSDSVIRFWGEEYSKAYAEDVFSMFDRIVNYGYYKAFWENAFSKKDGGIVRGIPVKMGCVRRKNTEGSKEIFIIGELRNDTNIDLLETRLMTEFSEWKKQVILYGDEEKIKKIKCRVERIDINWIETPNSLEQWEELLPKECMVMDVDDLLDMNTLFSPVEWVFICWKCGYIPIVTRRTKEQVKLCVQSLKTSPFGDRYVQIEEMGLSGENDIVRMVKEVAG